MTCEATLATLHCPAANGTRRTGLLKTRPGEKRLKKSVNQALGVVSDVLWAIGGRVTDRSPSGSAANTAALHS